MQQVVGSGYYVSLRGFGQLVSGSRWLVVGSMQEVVCNRQLVLSRWQQVSPTVLRLAGFPNIGGQGASPTKKVSFGSVRSRMRACGLSVKRNSISKVLASPPWGRRAFPLPFPPPLQTSYPNFSWHSQYQCFGLVFHISNMISSSSPCAFMPFCHPA